MVQPGHRYYYPHHPYHQQNTIFNKDYNNIVERNPYPFDGPYFDRRMMEPRHQVRADQIGYDRYGRYDSSIYFYGRVDPYPNYQAYYDIGAVFFFFFGVLLGVSLVVAVMGSYGGVVALMFVCFVLVVTLVAR